ncbi:hypothetical protein [uncultured Treponema sp.]|uniref:hypothetical protein n=1 Tax=uncultured Treponema sp. TaxID=162155 RepID=UPI0025E47671|nr:hypothetical protein [uncultured Treponema sp.]
MKKILFTLAALSLTSFSFAQEFDFGGSDSSDFGGSIEESSAPAVTISGEVGADARAWIGAKNKETGRYDTKAYDSFYDFSKTLIDAKAHANVELNYAGDYTDANIKFKLNPATLKKYQEDIIDEVSLGGSFKEGRFQIRAGKMKEVWGKGDKVHVLDNFNANDYTDFIFPDYIDRRIGEVMFKATANLSWDYNLKLEGIFTPWMTADRFADEKSPLYPAAQANLTNTVSGIVKHNAAIDLKTSLKADDYSGIVDGLQSMTSFSANDLYEDNIRSLKYGQAGLRLTGTLGGIDWGASYYYGHYKQPTANLGAYIDSLAAATKTYASSTDGQTAISTAYYQEISDFANYMGTEVYGKAAAAGATTYVSPVTGDTVDLTDSSAIQAAAKKDGYMKAVSDHAQEIAYMSDQRFALPSLNYDQLQVFGLEAAFVVWKLNTRWEFAYNLTEDTAGDNPWIKNNSISWVAGFDIDIPLHNLNLNVQDNGTYILGSDKIKDAVKENGLYAKYDTDYKSDDKYVSNKLIVLLSDKWLNEKLTTEVQGIWGIEHDEFMVAPKVEYNVIEGLTFAIRGVYFYSNNKDGEFYNFTADSENHDKAFVQLTAKYQF